MTGILWNLASFVVALGILVAVHEFGHFWVARRCGVKVEEFSIGFGKSLFQRRGKDGTLYKLALIPLGGYVKMLDSRQGEVPEAQKHLAFDHQSLSKRSAIVAAGPIFNFLFAIFAYWAIFVMGQPSLKPVIGEVTPSSIVAQANIRSGMEIRSIAGNKTPDWESVNMALISHIGDQTLELEVADANEIGQTEHKVLDISNWQFDPDKDSAMKTLGFEPYRPQIFNQVAMVSEDSAASRAGFIKDDQIKTVNGEAVASWEAFVEIVKANPNKALEVGIDRQGQSLSLSLTPQAKTLDNGEVIGYIGLAPTVGEWPDTYIFEQKFGVLDAIPQAIDKTGQVISVTFSMVKKLLTGDVGVQNLSGPISIAKGAGATADYGLISFLGFLALISVNLGIMNLFPLPVLDGGHLLFFAIEAVIRRPVPEKIQEFSYRLGMAAVLSLMFVALFNDFARL